MKKNQSNVGLFLVISWMIFALIDMWFDVVTIAVFIKISISVFVLFLLVFLFGALLSKSKD